MSLKIQTDRFHFSYYCLLYSTKPLTPHFVTRSLVPYLDTVLGTVFLPICTNNSSAGKQADTEIKQMERIELHAMGSGCTLLLNPLLEPPPPLEA